jgi:DNA-binding transcriptional LysR family regulator
VSSPNYDWVDLKYFLACARSGSLARAGRVLNVDQTTVSRRLTAFETAIGAKLFDRTAPRTTLTPAGQTLLDTAQRIEQGALEIGRLANGADLRVDGVVRLAVSETISVVFFARLMGRLHEAHPDIELQLVTGAAAANLLAREADLALRAGVMPKQQSLVVRKVGRSRFHLYASQAYATAHPKSRRTNWLAGLDVIGFCDELAQIPPAKWLEQRAKTARVALRTNSLLSAAEAAVGGWGIAALPSFVGDQHPQLVRIDQEPIGNSDLWLVVHPDLQRTARIRAVIEYLMAAMRDAGITGLDRRTTGTR